jgi:hypothetical protein
VSRKDFLSLLLRVQSLNKKSNSIGSEREEEVTARKEDKFMGRKRGEE